MLQKGTLTDCSLTYLTINFISTIPNIPLNFRLKLSQIHKTIHNHVKTRENYSFLVNLICLYNYSLNFFLCSQNYNPSLKSSSIKNKKFICVKILFSNVSHFERSPRITLVDLSNNLGSCHSKNSTYMLLTKPFDYYNYL